jgi:hypothetical protein
LIGSPIMDDLEQYLPYGSNDRQRVSLVKDRLAQIANVGK